MIRSKVAAGIYLVLVFLGGVLVGAFGYRLYTSTSVNASTGRPRNPEEYRKRYMAEMRSRLKLTDAQVSNLERILDETRQQFRDLHEKTQPQMKAIDEQRKAIQNQHVEKVRAMLNDVQRSEYEKMRAEREKRRQEAEQAQKPRT